MYNNLAKLHKFKSMFSILSYNKTPSDDTEQLESETNQRPNQVKPSKIYTKNVQKT